MEIKAYFREENTDLITIEINGYKIEDIPLETALDKYYDCDSVIDEIEKCCLQGDENSIGIWNSNKEWIYEERESRQEFENEEYSERGHGEQHKSLEEILGSIEDNNIIQQIEQIIQQYEDKVGEKMEYLAEGQDSTVFSIGDKIIKFGSIPTQEGAPLTLEPFERIQYEKNCVMRVLQKAEIGNVKREDLQQFYNEMRKLGYVWYDVKYDNVGWIEKEGKKELRVIDDIDVLSEEDILKGIPGKTKAYSSVLEFMQACDDEGALYEIQYQMTHNPNFDIKNLGQSFHRFNYDQETQISVSKLQIKFEEWSRETVQAIEPTEPTQLTKEELLGMAIQDARQQGMDAETIKKYIYPYQTVKGWKMEEFEKWVQISDKYGISKIMVEDYMSKEKGYMGSSSEIRDMIDNLTQREEQVSLTEIGEKSYQHFGSKIAEKLKETVGVLRSKFLSKDKDRTEDFTNER